MNHADAHDHRCMLRALELAAQGQGAVEPNPMVGCVIAAEGEIIGEGWHRRFGGAHAEVEALNACHRSPRGATMYVTLEPCCHRGKTPPCTEAVIAAGVGRVVIGMEDPFPQVRGHGIEQLRQAGISVEVGLLQQDARRLNAPYIKLLQQAQPWVIAKWAMTLDGKIATRSGHSQWISSESSRQIVHRLRGNVDAVIVGRTTAMRDDPLLTARPVGPRTAVRVVVDSLARLPESRQLVQTARQVPTLVACSEDAPLDSRQRLEQAGCEVLVCSGTDYVARFRQLLTDLGRRRFTNVLVEGGAQLLGSCFDAQLVDEVHAFIAPCIVGGDQAVTAISGQGVESMAQALRLPTPCIEQVEQDVHVWGRLRDA